MSWSTRSPTRTRRRTASCDPFPGVGDGDPLAILTPGAETAETGPTAAVAARHRVGVCARVARGCAARPRQQLRHRQARSLPAAGRLRHDRRCGVGLRACSPLAMPPSLAGPPTWSPSSPPRSTGSSAPAVAGGGDRRGSGGRSRLGDRRLHLLRQVCPARGGVRRGRARRLVPVGEVDERRWVGDRRAKWDPVRRPARDRTARPAASVSFYLLAAVLLVAAYLALHGFVTGRNGLVSLGIREDEDRVALLGYRVPAVKRAF